MTMPIRVDIAETPKSAKWKLSTQGKSAVIAGTGNSSPHTLIRVSLFPHLYCDTITVSVTVTAWLPTDSQNTCLMQDKSPLPYRLRPAQAFAILLREVPPLLRRVPGGDRQGLAFGFAVSGGIVPAEQWLFDREVRGRDRLGRVDAGRLHRGGWGCRGSGQRAGVDGGRDGSGSSCGGGLVEVVIVQRGAGLAHLLERSRSSLRGSRLGGTAFSWGLFS